MRQLCNVNKRRVFLSHVVQSVQLEERFKLHNAFDVLNIFIRDPGNTRRSLITRVYSTTPQCVNSA